MHLFPVAFIYWCQSGGGYRFDLMKLDATSNPSRQKDVVSCLVTATVSTMDGSAGSLGLTTPGVAGLLVQ